MTTAKPYILVVDDASDGREMLAEYLTFRGFSVVEAANGETAIDLVQKRRPAVILMDLQMPGTGGWDATRQLKANTATKDIIVIAHALAPDEGIARQAGCDALLVLLAHLRGLLLPLSDTPRLGKPRAASRHYALHVAPFQRGSAAGEAHGAVGLAQHVAADSPKRP